MTTAAPAPTDVLEKVDALGPLGTPVTTPEVAEGFDCTQRTIYNRLESLVDDDVLKTKKVGANSRVWWRPPRVRANGDGRDHRLLIEQTADRTGETGFAGDLADMRRLHDLRATLTNETDLHAALGEIIEAANDFLDTDRGCVQLVSDDGERLEMFEYRGYDEQSPFVNYFLHEGSKPACDAARQNRERLIIEDVERFSGLQGTTDREVALEDDIHAIQSTPMITRDGELVGVLSNQFPEPHRPSDRELRLIDMLAWTAAEFVDRHQTQEQLRESEARFRTLFDSISESMSEAFCVVEILSDEQVEASDGATGGRADAAARDEPMDYRFVESNAAFEALVGLTDVVGERRSELELPGDPPGFDAFGDVLRTGESKRVETNGYAHYDGWYDVHVFPYGGPDSETVAFLIDDITERKEAEQNLRESEARYRMLFESIIEGFCIIEVLFDEDDEPVDYRFLQTNPAFEEQTGLDDAEGKRMKELEPNHENRWFEIYGRIAKTGEPERFTNPAEHHDDRWYDVNAFRVGDPEERKVAIAFTDVSDSKHFQLALERLNEASQDLIDSDPEEIKDQTVDIVQSVLNVEYAALWCYDETTGKLDEYASQTSSEFSPDTVRLPGGFSEEIWQTFMDDDVDIDNDIDASESESATVSLRSRVLVPLGRHGVICAGSTQAEAFDEQNIGLVETVGGTVETAWDRAAGEEMLARRNEELTRLDRLNTLIREIDQALVAADTREEIDAAVCERLASSDLYEFAWIGDHDPGTGVVEPRAWAGVDSGYLEDLTNTVEDTPTNRDPIARAVRTGDLQVVSDIATDSDFAPWREATLERGARSLVCIPLVFDDATYGVLTVYADHPQSNEDERNQQVLSELGDTIAHTINARETRATLQTDSVVELTLRFEDADTPLCRLARETECTIDYQGFLPRSNKQADVFFIARGISPEEVQATASQLLAFDDLDCLTEGADGSLFRARVSDPPLAARVTNDGAVVRSITIDAGVSTAALDVPHTAAVREFLDRLRQWNPNFELRARQSCERPLKTRQTFVTALEDQLTDRQREVLQTAYLSGYFEMPRVSNGQEVTELLGVSQPTFSEHLRAAERTLCEVLFETEPYAGDIVSM
ncbi:bacterio-opsin activator domain-containing protein [Halomicrococcus sp. NG-SE-24]|uniref:bacterio-opsin activator domain-containing protein n=1 Tax=Halomicrococcus sp. NG-SE-24 TaxID=3436928 RepID=UPI003D9667F4